MKYTVGGGGRPAPPPRAAATPLDTWQKWATNVRGMPVNSGHFLCEEDPDATAKALKEFFAGA
jgi:haloacetate dehalogenase